jgi:hypothetical protein
MGRILYYDRQYDRVIEQFRATVDMDDSFWGAHYKLAEVYWTTGHGQ